MEMRTVPTENLALLVLDGLEDLEDALRGEHDLPLLGVLVDVLLPLREDLDADAPVRGLVAAAAACLQLLLRVVGGLTRLALFALLSALAHRLRLADVVDEREASSKVAMRLLDDLLHARTVLVDHELTAVEAHASENLKFAALKLYWQSSVLACLKEKMMINGQP